MCPRVHSGCKAAGESRLIYTWVWRDLSCGSSCVNDDDEPLRGVLHPLAPDFDEVCVHGLPVLAKGMTSALLRRVPTEPARGCRSLSFR